MVQNNIKNRMEIIENIKNEINIKFNLKNTLHKEIIK